MLGGLMGSGHPRTLHTFYFMYCIYTDTEIILFNKKKVINFYL